MNSNRRKERMTPDAEKGGMGSHQSAKMIKDEWLTPPALIQSLGEFDLDPCSPIFRPWDTAKHHFNINDDGLSQKWFGRVWMNPPYGQNTDSWMEKLVEHGNGIALIFARTETGTWFNWVWPHAHAILFLKGRLFFHHVSGNQARHNAGAPSALIAFGEENRQALMSTTVPGRLVVLDPIEPKRS